MRMTQKHWLTASTLGLALTLAAGPALAEEEMQQLELDLPEAMFEGTPKDLPDDLKLEENRLDKDREPIQVPPDATENVARDKPVEASEDWPIIGSAELITDGDKAATPGSYLELGPGLQWVQVDLEQPHEIFAIVMWHYHKQGRVYRDVVVQVADDPEQFIDEEGDEPGEDVKTIYNNDHDNSLGLGSGDDFEYIETNEGRAVRIPEGVTGQYVRLYSNGNTSNDQNHYIEVEVYGRPAETAAEADGDQTQADAQ